MSWEVDFTPTIRSDLVGLDVDAHEALIDALVDWTSHGPQRQGQRTLMEITFYEAGIGDRHRVAYLVDDERRRFLLLWVRRRPDPTQICDDC